MPLGAPTHYECESTYSGGYVGYWDEDSGPTAHSGYSMFGSVTSEM